MPGSASSRRSRHARQGGDPPAKIDGFASPPVNTRTASAFGRALAPCYGSNLLTLKLPWPCSQATPFVVPLEKRRFPALCQTRFPPRPARLFAHPHGERGPSGEVVSPSRFERAGSQSQPRPVRSLRFPCGSKLSTGSDSAGARFLIAARFAVPNSHPPRCDPRRWNP